MKKLITLTVLSLIVLILLIVGITQKVSLFNNFNHDIKNTTVDGAISNSAYINKTPTVNLVSTAVIFSILSVVWLFIIVLTIPMMKLKGKSMFLNIVLTVQMVLAPVAVLLTPFYLLMVKYGNSFNTDIPILKGGDE